MLTGCSQAEQTGITFGIRRFKFCALHAIAREFQNTAVGRVSKVDGVIICYCRKRLSRFLRNIRQNSPDVKNLAMAIKDLYSRACRIGHIDPSISINAEGKWAVVIAPGSDAKHPQGISLRKKQLHGADAQIHNVNSASG